MIAQKLQPLIAFSALARRLERGHVGDGGGQQIGVGELVPDARLDCRGRGLAGRLAGRLVRGTFGAALAAFLLRRLVLATRLRLVACLASYRCDPDVGGVVVHRTILNKRFQRTAVGQRQNIQTCSPSAMEKKISWARPTRFSIGT